MDEPCDDHDDEHGRRGRAGVDADDVGAGQRVAGQPLEDGPGQPEGGAHEQGGEPPGQAQGADDEGAVVGARRRRAWRARRAIGTGKSPTASDQAKTPNAQRGSDER